MIDARIEMQSVGDLPNVYIIIIACVVERKEEGI